MTTGHPDATPSSTGGDSEVVGSMTSRFGGALLVLALVSGTLISTLLYPPAAVASVVASIALAACLGRVASGGHRPGRPSRMAGVTLDITEHEEAELALQAAKEYADTLIDTANAMVVVLDNQGRVRGLNPAAERVTGYTRAELVGRSWFEVLVPKEQNPPVREAFDRLMAGGLARNLENAILTKAGAERHIAWQNGSVREQGEVVGTVSFGTDITDRKRTEEALARERSLLNELMTTIPDNIYFKDRDCRFTKVNHAMARWLGLGDPDDAVGKSDRDFSGSEHSQQAYADEQRIMATGQALVGHDEKETWPDGRTTWVSTSKVPLRDESGQVVGLVGVSRDITERRHFEDQARLGQKMEAIGRLAGGVAHDFNNILGVIIGFGELVLNRLPEEDPLRTRQEEVLKAAHRAAGLTRQLLAFGRRQVLQPKVLDLNGVVGDMDKMLRRLIGEDLELATTLDPDLGSVWADPGQIAQIVMNLAVNARDAMPGGGRLTVETKNVELDEAFGASHPPTRPGRYVMLAVSDTGSGMDAETQSHIFEPFFTTKVVGQGTGLGLPTVYGIVKQSDGYVWVHSEVGVGTTFRIFLPLLGDTAPAVCDASPSPVVGGSETILLVEDEASLRGVLHETLADNGYTVLVAGDGAAALQVADEHAGPIHLVVSDVVMPGMNGRQAAEELEAKRPGTKVLFVSGYNPEAIVRHGEFGLGTAFLSKPFTSAALLRKCRVLLDTR
jgi:two-component system, cell cycle sensor histidine kinase and response regulator CckA